MLIIEGIPDSSRDDLEAAIEEAYGAVLERAEASRLPLDRHILQLGPYWVVANNPASCLRAFDELRAMAYDGFPNRPTPLHLWMMVEMLERWLHSPSGSSADPSIKYAAEEFIEIYEAKDFGLMEVEAQAVLAGRRPRVDLRPFLNWLPPEVQAEIQARLDAGAAEPTHPSLSWPSYTEGGQEQPAL